MDFLLVTLTAATFVAAHSGTRTDSTGAAARVDVALQQRDTTRRPHAVEISDWYARRDAVHRLGSYTMLPLFAAQYVVGDRLMNASSRAGWVKPTHAALAGGVAALFAVNTVTGVWNLWDSRRDGEGRSRRLVHAVFMLAADAGFAWTGVLANEASGSTNNRNKHRNVALASMGVSTVGAALMWLRRD
jgi:hypothetical protein